MLLFNIKIFLYIYIIILQLRYIIGSTINNIPIYSNDNNKQSNSNTNRTITLFQAVDSSFLTLWLNWWAVALEFKAFPSDWQLHLACFGDNEFNELIKKFHKLGCSQIIPKSIYKKRVYFAKWTAVTKAFEEGNDLIVIDLDAVLIRDPRNILYFNNLQSSSYDIVSSRDHGPSDLDFSNHWGIWRFCTGFIFIKYSQKTLELVHASLRRCDKYGHDQIQFNNVVSRNSLIWNSNKTILNLDKNDQYAILPWSHQTHPDFILINETTEHEAYTNDTLHKLIVYDIINKPKNENLKINTFKDKYNITLGRSESIIDTVDVINIAMLKRFSVLRYCNEKQRIGLDFVKYLRIANFSYDDGQNIVALHCFVDTGPLGEQGEKKKQKKYEVMEQLKFWILKSEWSKDNREINLYKPMKSITEFSSIGGLINDYDDNKTKALLETIVDKSLLSKAKQIWLYGNKKVVEAEEEIDEDALQQTMIQKSIVDKNQFEISKKPKRNKHNNNLKLDN